MLKKLLIALSAALVLNACATSPTGRKQFVFMPDALLNQMGLQAFDSLKRENPVSNYQRHIQFVTCVSDTVIREVGGNWEVVVFEDKTLNAFALPGNIIGVHSGMVDFVDNQDQLATIIGHEVGHVVARHSNERVSQQMAFRSGMALIQAVSAPQTAFGQTALGLLGVGAQFGILLPFSRLHEREADKIGLDLMAKAGFDPHQSVTLWQKMVRAGDGPRPPEFMSTHPSHATRIQELQNAIPRALEIQRQAVAQGKQPRCSK